MYLTGHSPPSREARVGAQVRPGGRNCSRNMEGLFIEGLPSSRLARLLTSPGRPRNGTAHNGLGQPTSLVINAPQTCPGPQANLRETIPQLKFSLSEVCQVDNQDQLPQVPTCSSQQRDTTEEWMSSLGKTKSLRTQGQVLPGLQCGFASAPAQGSPRH